MTAPLPSIALIAHDAKKDDLVAFSVQHKETLGRFHLIATGTTGGRIQQATGLQIECLLSGPLGGDLQIGSRIACGEVHMVIFLRDPLTAHAHEPDISALVKICDIRNIAIATNLSSANILVHSLQENI